MVLRLPLVRHKLAIVRYIHDFVAHEEEMLAHKRLGEEVGYIVIGRYERYAQQAVLDAFSDKIDSDVDQCASSEHDARV